MKSYLLKTDGSAQEVTPKDGKEWSLPELQGFVGGYIQIVYPTRIIDNLTEIEGHDIMVATMRPNQDGGERMILVLNEDGLREELAPNPIATLMYGGMIVGDVLYCPSREVS